MTSASHKFRMVCLGLIAALSLAMVRPALADDESDLDPTIVRDDPAKDDVPDGVKDLGSEHAIKKAAKPAEDLSPPIYKNWWFWAGAVAITGVVAALAVIPLTGKARPCGAGVADFGCLGDGR